MRLLPFAKAEFDQRRGERVDGGVVWQPRAKRRQQGGPRSQLAVVQEDPDQVEDLEAGHAVAVQLRNNRGRQVVPDLLTERRIVHPRYRQDAINDKRALGQGDSRRRYRGSPVAPFLRGKPEPRSARKDTLIDVYSCRGALPTVAREDLPAQPGGQPEEPPPAAPPHIVVRAVHQCRGL